MTEHLAGGSDPGEFFGADRPNSPMREFYLTRFDITIIIII